MPTPSRTSLDEIVSAGRSLIETHGLEGLTMQKVAASVGVQPPSLYKHVASRGELVAKIIETVAGDLGESLESAVSGDDPHQDLISLAQAFRDFARAQPEAHRLMFASIPEDWRPDLTVLAAASAPVLRTTEALAGPDHALEAARLVTAWAYGFTAMEAAGAFRMGGDVDEAFTFGITTLAATLASRGF
jgi:AcrR family transcriptional regulator